MKLILIDLYDHEYQKLCETICRCLIVFCRNVCNIKKYFCTFRVHACVSNWIVGVLCGNVLLNAPY